VNLLLDTHVLLWWLFDDRRLPRRARLLIEAPEANVQTSVVSLWETSIKVALKRAAADPLELYHAILDSGFGLLSIAPLHAVAVASLPRHHGDPFDRMLIAQAQAERLTLVTHDRTLAAYEVAMEIV